MAQFCSGSYIIKSTALSGQGNFIGRDNDGSLAPKKVFGLPYGVEAPIWDLLVLPSGRVQLKIGGASLSEQDGRLWASLMNGDGEEWAITYREYHNAYTIQRADATGWVSAPTFPCSQIKIQPLVYAPSDPPYFPASELWKFIRQV
ncbi:hypothetical protein BV22DRAFT_1130052 [Leucogyrophana mollusca]|uniref:Uncharacterized protein n=1 Tax=Leucogyrophana mollusca TaxID=85980 RepID=A0ACB8BFJ1_9AGAM|nr:hypothetical protein BV22DRAFT_1130052 [Leucogyrophana mollusca]